LKFWQGAAMGLRERHKAGRETRILDAARMLFLERGYDSVKVEHIAERAEVSVGTLYNYFGGKPELILRLSILENARVAGLAEAFDLGADRPVTETLVGLIQCFFQPESMMLRQDLWRTGFALAFGDVRLRESREFLSSDGALRQIVIVAARELQGRGLLRGDVDCAVFGAALYNNANVRFLEFTWAEDQTVEDLNARITSETAALVHMALPRGSGG
jgi:AcrR family transcriptional regulator